MSDKDREKAEEKSAEEAAVNRSDDEAEGAGSTAEARPPRSARAKDVSGDGGEPSTDEAEAAQRVAEALGVGEGDEVAPEAAAGDEAKAAPNRAARRREDAVTRRRKKKPSSEELPKDKNARAKELLARRREQAEGRRSVQLLPGEMVEDALSRMTSSAGKWIRNNFAVLQGTFLLGLIALGGALFYLSRVDKTEAEASAALGAAVAADRGVVLEEDKRTDEQKELDPTKVFKTSAERADAALAAYNQVIDQHGGTGAAILAKLGQAGTLLDKKDYAHALDAYSAVVSSPLAGADPDVKGRAIEGIAFAREGKGDLDGALASFKELESIDLKGYKELSLYHQARVLVAKGDKAKATELLKAAYKTLAEPSADAVRFPWLVDVVGELLRELDPTAAPRRPAFGGPAGQSMTPEQIEELIRRARENAQKKAGDAQH